MENTTRQYALRRFKKGLLSLFFFMTYLGFGQVSNYEFSQEQSTYTALVNPSSIAQASNNDLENTSYPMQIPFDFPFDNRVYNQFYVHSSGFVSFGLNAPFGNTPLSNTVTRFEGAIAALAAPITAKMNTAVPGNISFQIQGVQPNRTVVVQWENFSFYSGNSQSLTDTYNLNFQIRLSEDGAIHTVYDLTSLGNAPSFTAQVGLRGNLVSDYNNRYAVGNTTTNNFMSSTPGGANSSVIFIYKDFLPTSGFSFAWKPSDFCLPVFQYGPDSEMITHVTFNTINNPSPSRSGTTPVYEDFRSISTDLQKGDTYPITVKGPAGYFSSDVMVYIDFNNNGKYDDPGEGFYLGKIGPGNPANALQVTGQIPIPTTAVSGPTGMRIVKNSGIIETNSISHPCATDLRAGQVEDYTVNILGTTTTPTCDNTVPGINPGDTGCITLLYQGVSVVYKTVRAEDGNIWLQQNMGSPEVATSSNDAANYGDLFQWGRWDDGHQLRNAPQATTAVTPNNPLGLQGGVPNFLSNWWNNPTTAINWDAPNPQATTAESGCDPCKALGGDWQIPTDVQWQNIIQAETITNAQTAFDSNLKLTVAGSRSSSEIIGEGIRGYYWSKSNSGSNSDFSKFLYYSNITMNPNAGAFRSQGSSVRCIKLATVPEPVFPAPYCGTDGVTTSTVSEITSVTLGGITKTSPFGQPNAPLIEDFTATIIELQKEIAHPIAVIGGTQGQSTVSVYAYIDWNQNDEFDSDEAINLGYLTNGADEIGQLTSSITIPSTALLGHTRLRLVKAYESSSSMGTLLNLPCPTGWFIGQVEDYTVNITAAPVVINPERIAISIEDDREPLIDTVGGTLQLQAQVMPTTANQQVIWSLTTGSEFIALNETGLLTATANGTAVVRATAINNTEVFAELTITVNIPALCPSPTAITLAIPQTDRVDISWEFANTAEITALFQYELRTHGAVGTQEGLVQSGETDARTITLSSLIPNTTYLFYLRNQCEVGVFSVWSPAQTFTTACAFVEVPVSNDQTFCGDKQILNLVVSGGANARFNWYDSATSSTPLAVNTLLTTKTYFVAQSINACESERISISVTINPGIAAPQVVNQSFCTTGITVANLQVTALPEAVVSWFTSLNATAAMALTDRIITGYYYVSQKIGDCESSRVLVSITVVDNSVAPAVSDQRFCGTATVGELRAIVLSGMQARWYDVSEGGSFLPSNTALTTAVYYVAQGWNGCESPRRAVSVQIDAIPEQVRAEINQEVNNDATIKDLIVLATNPIWYASFADAEYDRNRLDAQSPVVNGTTYFVVDITENGCGSIPLGITVNTTLKTDGFDQSKFSYYPNPTRDFVWIKYQEVIESYQLFNASGQLMSEQSVRNSEFKMDLSPFASGVYLIYLNTQTEQQLIRVIKK